MTQRMEGYYAFKDRVQARRRDEDGYDSLYIPFLPEAPRMGQRLIIEGVTYTVEANGSAKAVERWALRRNGIVAATINPQAYVAGTWQPILFYVLLAPATDIDWHWLLTGESEESS